ncbi:MAG: hypothetical protein A2046_02985 [Bacteroidetes bacterium GWA2_30_7]|nr:MAG: hypothetical protein A2046_02985 [Bacteroidetes bacterium GWA2_30_7]
MFLSQLFRTYNKSILIIFLIIISNLFSYSQNSYFSPYSRYGIGDFADNNFGQAKAMGKSSIALRSKEHLNINNPASYSAIDTLNFIFEVGYFNKYTNYSTNSQNIKRNDANLSYITLGFPVTKWWGSSIGLLPYSILGYNISSKVATQELDTAIYNYIGSGGINQFYFGNSFKLFKNFSIGANISYLFGSLAYEKNADFYKEKNAFEYHSNDSILINDLFFDFGFQYSKKLKDEQVITIGGKYNNKDNINASRSQLIQTVFRSSPLVISTLIDTADEKGTLEFPLSFGFGISYTKNNKLILIADYVQQNWSDSKFFGVSDSLLDSRLISAGLEYIPKFASLNNYFKRVRYRLGGYYSNSYINVNNNQINDFGITFGFGLPLRKTKTSFNLSFELGQRGTTTNNLIKEKYVNIGINLTLHDFWFFKRKIE